MTEFGTLYPLQQLLVETVIDAGRTAAWWNGNKRYVDAPVSLVTNDFEQFRRSGFGTRTKQSDDLLGLCTQRYHTIGIWYRGDDDHSDVLRTLAHEVAHGFTSVTSSHDASWRRLYGILYHLIGRFHQLPLDTSAELRRTLKRYTTPRVGQFQWSPKRGGFWTYDESWGEYDFRIRKEEVRILTGAEKFLVHLRGGSPLGVPTR
jgi:hypothetical protein